jgi:predicted nucleic-acid-binding Zn-ribbon protein
MSIVGYLVYVILIIDHNIYTMLDVDNTLGIVTLHCDNCGYEEEFENNDTTADIKLAVQQAREYGWKISYSDEEWEHLCPSCFDSNL